MNKTIYYSILHLFAGITLGYILFSCEPEYKSNMMLRKGIMLEYEDLNK
jgi:hypothetical protein